MEEINLKELFSFVKSKILFILLVVVVALFFGNFYSLIIKRPLYQSNTTIILTSTNQSESGDTLNSNDVQLNKNLVDTYSVIIKSRRVLSRVINSLNLDYSIQNLADKITVTAVENTPIIKVTVIDRDAELACKMTDKIADVFSDEIKKIYNIQNVSVVDDALVADSPYNKNLLKENIIYILVGLVGALAVIFVQFYFDTTIKSGEEIEEKLGLTILGIVPRL